MAHKLKVMTVVGTRPEIIRLSEVIKELDRVTDHVFVHTGQNYDYELNEIFFKDLKLRKPNYVLEVKGETPIERTSSILSSVDEVIAKEAPDAFFVLGDTNSALSVYAAKRRKIPIFHAEAGNRCFDQRVPEEINRRIVDHTADVNLTYSERARENLLREGLPPDRTFVVGSPMSEVLAAHKKAIANSKVLKELSLKTKEYFVVSFHREENVENPLHLHALRDILEHLATTYKKPIIFSAHPRTRNRLEQNNVIFPKAVRLMKPLSYTDFMALQQHALCTLSDSGTISEESSILGFPALNLRETHERHEAMDEGTVIMTGLNASRIIQGLEMALEHTKEGHVVKTPEAYQSLNVSKKIVRILLSYVDYVNRRVWYKKA